MYLYPYICTVTDSHGVKHTSRGVVALNNYREFSQIIVKWNSMGRISMNGLQYEYGMDIDGIIRKAPANISHGDIIPF